jgi:2-polyprenyl-3-methyl-5-hydroxy-6-metoxy-1,4-benzoquinol methylase
MATALKSLPQASRCRFCKSPLENTFVDLGAQPPSNSYLHTADLSRMESFYPLRAFVCSDCHLVQLEQFQTPKDIFGDYAYFSSYSAGWLRHAETYCDAMIDRFDLGPNSQVVEIASNDGYLLQYFVKRDVPVLGVEPAANVARVAEDKGVPTRVDFFGRSTAEDLVTDGLAADLLVGNNVLAHVPDLNDFVAGLKILLKPDGVLTMEFPHLLQLMNGSQFDTIYHEHFSYFSLLSAEKIFAAHGIKLFDVEDLPTHGGSLRIYGCHADCDRPLEQRVAALKSREIAAGLDRLSAYEGFMERVKSVKRGLLSFLIKAKDDGKSIAAYGAAAKGNTLLNYCGIGTDMLDYVVDSSPHKQELYLPGSHIPIVAPDRIRQTQPDYLLILPWNLTNEIIAANDFIRAWGGKFVVPIPAVTVIE